MDPNELIKAAPELAKGAGALAAAIPFTAIVKRMLGPAADELAEILRDQVRLYRYERQLKCLEKAERMALEAGFTPQAVPPKILFPLLDGASFEGDESLHDMWSALLANAASPSGIELVRPGFIAILRGLAPDEAALLNWLYETADDSMPPLNQATLIDAYVKLGFAPKEADSRQQQLKESQSFIQKFAACRDSLESARLLRRSSGENDVTHYSLSLSGRAFVGLCRPPKANANG